MIRSPSPEVLYVMGSGRSGTTLLGALLGELPGVFNAGELSYVWERGILEPRSCGCGHQPLSCPIWSQVLAPLAGGGELAGLAGEMKDARRNLRLRDTWRLLSSRSPLDLSDQAVAKSSIQRYGETMGKLYRRLAEVTGAQLIVDISKHPADAAMVGRFNHVGSLIVHMVRDSRAVVNSWRRNKEGISRRKVATAAADWLVTNAAGDAVRQHYPTNSLLLRYEDLLADPEAQLHAVADRLGLSVDQTPFLDHATVELHGNHTVSGNPDRFRIGRTQLRADDLWHIELPRPAKLLVTLMTWPALRRYGYSLFEDSGD
jgi:hypothetical protein